MGSNLIQNSVTYLLNGLLVTVTPRILIVCTLLSCAILAENFSFCLLSENNISWLFAILNVKWFACAQ